MYYSIILGEINQSNPYVALPGVKTSQIEKLPCLLLIMFPLKYISPAYKSTNWAFGSGSTNVLDSYPDQTTPQCIGTQPIQPGQQQATKTFFFSV